METKIRIPSPCSENWNSMSAKKQGRFCNACNKTVIDFRKMKDTEIEKYFAENSNQETICGYYKFNQVESGDNDKYSNLKHWANRIKVRPIKALALLLLGFLFTFSSCIMGKRAEEKPSDVIENDTVNQNEIKDTLQNTTQKNDSIKSTVNKSVQKKQ